MERKAKAATVTGAYLFVVAAILVIANLISFKNYKRFDMTSEERYTLSQGSRRLVSEGLSQDLQVDVYVTRGLAKTDLFIQDLSALLREYETATSTRDGATTTGATMTGATLVGAITAGKSAITTVSERIEAGVTMGSARGLTVKSFKGLLLRHRLH